MVPGRTHWTLSRHDAPRPKSLSRLHSASVRLEQQKTKPSGHLLGRIFPERLGLPALALRQLEFSTLVRAPRI